MRLVSKLWLPALLAIWLPAQAPTPAPPPGAQPPAQQSTPPQTEPPKPAPQPPPVVAPLTDAGGFRLQNVSLLELVDILARRLKINYVLDPRVKGGTVTINTYGEVRPTDLMQLLHTILRINGAAIVPVDNLYRVVPITVVPQLPISPIVNGKDLPGDERMVLNLMFLKFVTVAEMAKLLQPFLGEGAQVTAYEPANLLLILDNARNMKRTLDLLSLFDSETMATQRVKLFEVAHGRPSELVKELESVMKAFSLSDKAAVRFLPVDRINTIIAVAPNPGAFVEVEKWLRKLDIPVKATAGAVNNYVYRLRYGRAETVGMAVMALYSGNPAMLAALSAMSFATSMGGMGGGAYGMGGGFGMGGGMYGMGGGMYGMGGGMYGMGGMGMMGMAMPGMGGYGYAPAPGYPTMFGGAAAPAGAAGAPAAAAPGATPDQTGTYLGAGGGYGMFPPGMPRIIPNPFDNTLLVQASPQEWERISNLLEQLDIPPRQVLIDAKIYEVDLTGAFSSGVSAVLQRRGAAAAAGDAGPTLTRQLAGTIGAGGTLLTAGLLVGQSRELLGLLTAQESTTRARVISAPSVIATDSIAATLNVGQEVPTLSSQAVAPGVQQGGSSLFTNTIANRNTGVSLNILARVNSSGIVTLQISQDVSAPVPTTSSSIQSPSFQKRNVQTQVTVQDGDTIAIGGIIQETATSASSGVPVLHRIPILGAAFGSRRYDRARTELVVFLTPRVIYDTNQITEATDEIKGRMKKLVRIME